MKIRTALSALVMLLVTATFSTAAHAQVDAYSLTGTIDYAYTYTPTDGYTYFSGQSVAGQVTLDRGDTPNYLRDYNDSYYVGQYGQWTGDGFSVNLDVAGLGAFGSDSTEAGGTNYYWNYDLTYYYYSGAYQGTGIQSYFYDGSRYSYTSIRSWTYGVADDGVAEVANPWDPLTDIVHYGYHYEYDYTTGAYLFFQFTLDSFEGAPTTIVIDGCDTGIDDFDSNGQSASAQINAAADGARNHGQFVSSVAKLTNEWKKAGLITDDEKSTIMECAAQSSIGKK